MFQSNTAINTVHASSGALISLRSVDRKINVYYTHMNDAYR